MGTVGRGREERGNPTFFFEKKKVAKKNLFGRMVLALRASWRDGEMRESGDANAVWVADCTSAYNIEAGLKLSQEPSNSC
jgi:hypothetical protein